MDRVMIIGGPAGLPPGMQDLIKRLYPKEGVGDCPMAQDLKNAHKQNLELLRKVDGLERKNKVLAEDNKMFESRTCSSEAGEAAIVKEIERLRILTKKQKVYENELQKSNSKLIDENERLRMEKGAHKPSKHEDPVKDLAEQVWVLFESAGCISKQEEGV